MLGSVYSSSSDPFRVLAPEVPLSKIAEEAESQEYLDAIEKVEPELEDLPGGLWKILILIFLLLMTMLDVIDLCTPASVIGYYTSF